jgi:1-acyl-sn-glycerol-3-phosphate acyltransferase
LPSTSKFQQLKILASIYHTARFWILTTVLSLVLGIVSIIAGFFDKSGNTSHRIASLWSRLICVLNGIQVEIVGLENIPADQPQIFVANHQSYFDIFAISGYFPVQIRWVAKESLFRIPFVGWSMKAAGYIGLDRDNKRKAFQAFVKTTEKLKAGCSIVIFPEGTRSVDGRIGPFKKGGHLLALRSKTPMLPIAIIGSGSIICKKSAVIHPGPVKIVLSKPVSLEQLKSQGEQKAMEKIRETICNLYEENKKLEAEKRATPA